jgi:hypothetical protein
MLDIFHLQDNTANVQIFNTPTSANNTGQWHVWEKPRGAKFVYLLAVGGGGSGGCGINTGASSGGGAGGGSGALTTLFIPAMFLPDTLFIQVGQGGKQPAALVSGALSVAGIATCISAYPSINNNDAILRSSGGIASTTAATTTAGGTSGLAGSITSAATISLGYKFTTTLLAGQNGGAGGTSTGAGTLVNLAGTFLCSGSGGGGSSATPGAGGNILTAGNVVPLGGQYFPQGAASPTATLVSGGGAASGSTPAGSGQSGFVSQFLIRNFGGTGGGGASTTAGGVAGAGGDGAPGCGGGGAGGSNTTNPTLARPGNGGDGFAIIMSV